jgi:hypothetical protein
MQFAVGSLQVLVGRDGDSNGINMHVALILHVTQSNLRCLQLLLNLFEVVPEVRDGGFEA